MPAVVTRTQGKSQFVREMLGDDPHANARAVKEAWRAAGMPGTIRGRPIDHPRFRMGLLGICRVERRLA